MNASDFNVQQHQIEPYVLVDELSSEEIYIGTSKSFNEGGKSIWKIKRIVKIGTVWEMGYPNGNQDFVFVWDNRLSYDYK